MIVLSANNESWKWGLEDALHVRFDDAVLSVVVSGDSRS